MVCEVVLCHNTLTGSAHNQQSFSMDEETEDMDLSQELLAPSAMSHPWQAKPERLAGG
jgi:hypothetical protein